MRANNPNILERSSLVKKFKENFIFGAATSSYQIEGAVFEDDRSLSIWDTFCKTPGKIYGGHNGDITCDHYHRYKEDVKLMAEIGLKAYRFSISWPRIFTEKGKYNPKGMDFYKNLVNELNQKNIIPAVTLYHWDLPLWVYNIGGWLNRESVEWFKEYAIKVFEELNDSVKFWITHNEPFYTSIPAYYQGMYAPGHKNLKEALTVSHHVLLSHGAAVEAFREFDFKDSKIGIALNIVPSYPESGSKNDIEAAIKSDGHLNRWFLDPIFKASYPEDMKRFYNSFIDNFDFIKYGDLRRISVANDFLGINYYTREIIKYSEDKELGFRPIRGDYKRTAMDWEIVPESLYDLISEVRKWYTKIPIYITENGAAFNDRVSKDGKVHDSERIEYLRDHLIEVARLNENKMDIRGYFLWSLLDNFEWAYGYSKRFGIIYVNYKTNERVFKDSAIWYKNLIKTRSLS